MNFIVVFARAPLPGRVKTRLAAHVGAQAAAKIYAGLLQDTLEIAENAARVCEAQVILCFTPADAFDAGEFALSNLWNGPRMAQKGADLGEKMRLAFGDCFEQGAKRVVIIGSDLPELSSALLRRAFDELKQTDLVFGPAFDGGFYLIGANAPPSPVLFENVEWSHESTLGQTLRNADDLHERFALLPEWADIDEWRDVQRILRKRQLPQTAPHFYAALQAENLL